MSESEMLDVPHQTSGRRTAVVAITGDRRAALGKDATEVSVVVDAHDQAVSHLGHDLVTEPTWSCGHPDEMTLRDAPLELPGKATRRLAVESEHHHAGGFTIERVQDRRTASKPPLEPQSDIGKLQRVDRVRCDRRRFIDNEDVSIPVDDPRVAPMTACKLGETSH